LVEILTGYVTLGDGEFVQDSETTAHGTGSFGFVAGLFALLNDQLQDFGGFADPTLDKADFIVLPHLTVNDDADADGFTNLEEYEYYVPNTCPGGSPPKRASDVCYRIAALNPTIFPGDPDVVEPGPIVVNFCQAFYQLVTNSLLENVDPEFAQFIALLEPNRADINGSFYVDTSGPTLVAQLAGNGILDAANEFGLIQRVLNTPDFNNGVLNHEEMLAAWNANLAQLDRDIGALAPLVANLIPGLREIFVAALTLGDGDFTIYSQPTEENPDAPVIVEGNGSYGFVAAIFALLDYFVKQQFGTGFANPNIQKADYVSFPALLKFGDADGDGYSNWDEYQYFTKSNCPVTLPQKLVSTVRYKRAALEPDIYPGNVPEGEGTPEGQAEGSPEGQSEGQTEGSAEGTNEGAPEGVTEGQGEGNAEGTVEGAVEGSTEGTTEAATEGVPEGEGTFECVPHSADTNGDFQISVSELLRVIQFYNSGSYHCSAGTEDGYGPGFGQTGICPRHASDYLEPAWKIDLSELLRLIQLYNTPSRAYVCQPGTEDNYAPAPR
jgi:hypothetical protein